MERELDCRGLACPAPVLQTKELIEKEHPYAIKVTVDNEAAKQNVSRFLESQQFAVSVEEDGSDFHVIGEGVPGSDDAKTTVSEDPGIEKKKTI